MVPRAQGQVREGESAPRAPKALELPPQNKPPSNRWLQDADSDADRFKKLEIYLRGFDQPMWEVGERFRRVYQAIRDRNLALADYHWQKIALTINTGLMKRPSRTQSAEAFFLDVPWKAMSDAIQSKSIERVEQAFMEARQACMACHVAEKVPFMNEQPLFRELTFE
jgi:hypothetical protein